MAHADATAEKPSAAEFTPPANATRIMVLLFLANFLNFFDRVIPAVVTEPMKEAFDLTDTELGLLGSAFTLVYAIAGLPIGRAADKYSRRMILGWGLFTWSFLTGVTGLAWNYASLFLIRLGVGVGEASYAPAANALIADLYPASKRSRATGWFMLGLPLGLLLAFFTVGSIVEAFDTWRAPFFFAAVPGLIVAFLLGRITEPKRGASDGLDHEAKSPDSKGAIKLVLKTKTLWFLIFAFCFYNVASYVINTFTVSLVVRYFGFGLTGASVATGVVVGVTGLLGLTYGSKVLDKAAGQGPKRRVIISAIALAISAPLALIAFMLGQSQAVLFVIVLSVCWLLTYLFFGACYPAVADVVPPQLRATAMALLFAIGYVLGGAGGPLIAGALSDKFATAAIADGVDPVVAVATGLHQSMAVLVPPALALCALFMFLASRTVTKDHAREEANA